MKKGKFFALLVLFVFVSCRKEPTSWNSEWNLIVLQDTLSMKNLVTDSILGVNTDGAYRLLINRDLLNLNLDDVVSFPDTLIEQSVAIPVSISVPPGTQFIDQIENNTFNFQGVQLKKLLLGGGKAKVNIKSPIATMCIVTLTLPGVKKNGQDFQIQVEVPAGSVASPSAYEIEVDLSGYEIDLSGVNGDTYNVIQSQFRVRTDPSGGAVNVNTSQVISFEVRFLSMQPTYARGYFGNRVFEEIQELDLDFMNRVVSGAIDLENVNLKLTLFNGIKVGARARINQLEGENLNGTTVALAHPQVGPWIWINQAMGTWDDLQASVHDIELTSENSNIEAFIENLPLILRVNFAFEINPFGNTSGGWDELFSTSFVRAFLTADMPLSLGMNNLTLRDTFDLKLGETGAITPKSGAIRIKTFNAYSFSASLQMQVLGENQEVLLTKSGNGNIAGSNSISNFAPVNVVPSEVIFEFDEAEMQALLNMHRIVLTAVFNSPNSGEIATIYSGQFLAFRVFSDLRLRTSF